jgi:uncharacterized membrane protein (GlpM family)
VYNEFKIMDIILKSLIGAVIIAVVLIVSKFAGPRVGGAIGGLPLVFAVSYILVTQYNKTASREFLIGGIYGAIAAIFFSLILIWLNVQFAKNHWLNFVVAYVLCFFLSLGLVYAAVNK